MQSLKNLQTWAKVFKVIIIVVIVFSCIGIVSGIIGFFFSLFTDIPEDVRAMFMETTSEEMLESAQPNFLITIISFCATLAVQILTLNYLNKELEDGTPFTHSGAMQLFKLAIIGLILPAVASLISGVVVLAYGIDGNAIVDTMTEISIGYATGLIVLSQVFKYGADLRCGVKEENTKIEESEMGSNEIKEIALSDSFEEKSAENNQNESKDDKKEEN